MRGMTRSPQIPSDQGSANGAYGPPGHGANEVEAQIDLLVAWAGHPGRDDCANMHWLPVEWEESTSRPSTTDFSTQAHCTLEMVGT